MKDIESSVAQLIEAYKAAVLAKDVEAFMRLYAPGRGSSTPGACGRTRVRRPGNARWKAG